MGFDGLAFQPKSSRLKLHLLCLVGSGITDVQRANRTFAGRQALERGMEAFSCLVVDWQIRSVRLGERNRSKSRIGTARC